MAKRMIVMLTVTALFVAALGFVKFKQIQTAIAQAAAFQPPPEAVTTIVARAGDVAGDAERHRHDGRGAGRDRQRRPSRHRRSHRVRFGHVGPRGRRAGAARHAAGAGAAGRRRSAARAGAPQLRPDAGPAERARHLAGGVRPRDGRAESRRRHGSGRSAPRSTGKRSGRRFRASSASGRSTWGSTCRAAMRSSRCSR